MTCLLVEGKRRGIFYLQRRDILYSLAYPGARYAGSSYCICELLKTSPGEYARCQIHGRRFHWDGKPGAVPKEGISDPIALSLSKGDRIIQNLSRFDPSPALRTGKLSANGVFLFGHPRFIRGQAVRPIRVRFYPSSSPWPLHPPRTRSSPPDGIRTSPSISPTIEPRSG
jgi:hypothetical protein